MVRIFPFYILTILILVPFGGCLDNDTIIKGEDVESNSFGAFSVVAPIAVSYTHLTLPTILLV